MYFDETQLNDNVLDALYDMRLFKRNVYRQYSKAATFLA